MKKIILTIIALGVVSGVFARRIEVATADAVSRAKPAPGDTVVIRAGELRDCTFTFRGMGTADRPIVLMAETPGSVVVTGNSQLSISGEYIVVSGFHFKDIVREKSGYATFSFRTNSTTPARHCTLTECLFTGDGVAKDDIESKWVSIYGERNTVSHCTFIDKANMGTLLVVWLEEDVIPYHVITGNYFSRPRTLLDDKGNARNGQETVRIGTSDVSMQDARCEVTGNYFYRCNGEIEVISNKSCENVYRGNVLAECGGALTLRHGNRCVVDGNFFFGNNVPESGGVRVIGEEHKIFNNYFNSIAGTGYRAAICLIQGEANPELSGYFHAYRIQVVFNTLVNCREGIYVNYGSSRQNQPVENITIANNVVYTTQSKSVNFLVKNTPSPPQKITWKNNFSYGGNLTQITLSEVDAEPRNPGMSETDGLWRPSEKSILGKYADTGSDFVDHDALGRPRGAKKIPGAFELAAGKSELPTPTNTGITWKRPN